MTDEQNPTQKISAVPDLSQEQVQKRIEAIKNAPPLPRCPSCKEKIPGLYFYVYTVAAPGSSEKLLFQAICCPFDDCNAVLNVYPIGKMPATIAHPSGAAWPGLKQ
jgi:hypothetical protein